MKKSLLISALIISAFHSNAQLILNPWKFYDPNTIIVNTPSVNVGIGIDGPVTTKLYVEGDTKITGDLLLGKLKINSNGHRQGLLKIPQAGVQSWSGLSVEHTPTSAWSIMGDQDDFGLYDDYNSKWALLYNENNSLELFYDGSKKFNTTSTGIYVTGTSTADRLIDRNNTAYYMDPASTSKLNQTDANYYDLNSGNGKGLRFWNSDNYKIHMGNSSVYKYGPVQDYSIKHNMNNDSDRGWTWGVIGTTPVAALNTQGKMQIKSDFITEGRLGVGTTSPSASLHVRGTSYDGTPNVAGTQVREGIIELTRNAANPFIDFQNDINGTDYDARIELVGNDDLMIRGAHLRMADFDIKEVRALQMKDWDDNSGGTNNKYRILARDGAVQVYNGGLVVGGYGNGTWNDLADGSLVVKTNQAIGKTTVTSGYKLDVNGAILASGGNSNNWNTAYTQRGSQIAGTGLSWTDGKLNVTGVTTDDQKIDVLSLSGKTLNLSLEGDAEVTKTLDLSGIDNQTIDVFSLSGKTLNISLDRDGQATRSLNLGSIDNQTIDELSLSGEIMNISLAGDGQATKTLNLSSIDDQTIDVLSLSGKSLNISLSDDGQPTKTLDLSKIDTKLTETEVDDFVANNGFIQTLFFDNSTKSLFISDGNSVNIRDVLSEEPTFDLVRVNEGVYVDGKIALVGNNNNTSTSGLWVSGSPLLTYQNQTTKLYAFRRLALETTETGILVHDLLSTENHGNSSEWNTAFTERGSQIAGAGLTWENGVLNVSSELTATIQKLNNLVLDQSTLIKDQNKKIKELEVELINLKESSKTTSNETTFVGKEQIKLLQNIPNPFSQETMIEMSLPNEVKDAKIIVYDLKGTELKSFDVNSRGLRARIIIKGNELEAGMYIYALIADSQIMDSKRMILTK